MKFRNGFVSNSSSSSFILKDKSMSANLFAEDVKQIWKRLHDEGVCSEENLDNVSEFYTLSFVLSENIKKDLIYRLYDNQCWDAKGKINSEYISKWDNLFLKIKKFIHNLFCKSYLNEAMKANVFGVSGENEIPYEVLEELRKKYKNLTIHHLG